ncbi:MAG TPA: PQQ-binding-like beta-propeller repeat protein [Verrucomicrobiae bacterium]
MRLPFLTLLFVALSASAADWAQFQGPNGDGTSPETGLLRAWPTNGPAIEWRAPIGQGWGAPSVAGDDVVLAWSEERSGMRETVACLERRNGKERWRATWNTGPYWVRNIGWAPGGVRATPVITDKFVFAVGAVGHVFCLDRKNGAVVWARDLWRTWLPSGEKGYDFSPIIVDGKLILWLSDGASESTKKEAPRETVCLALDPETGRELWTFREPHRRTASMGEGQTPAIADFAGARCIVVTANCQLKALRVSDGREVWKFDCIRPDARATTIPTPLVVGNLILDMADGDGNHVVEVDRSKPDLPTRMLWKKDQGLFTAIHQFRPHEGFLYGFLGHIEGESEKTASDSKLDLTCMELATGKIRWKEPGYKTGVAIIEADGLLFVRSYQTLHLIAAEPDACRHLGEVKTHDVWKPTRNLTDFVSPVLAAGRLYIRTPDELLCYRVKK